ncbi:putative replicase [Frankliniella occidentalis associated mesonivirus 1]|uniref:Replicase polyprotein 1ab n=1 Tax=Frankliniella occidentalis associated mesonivirus 1 TaxID=2767230 RepID=A0AAE7JCV0_9NIDO|nr:putative replicase [Frankliniella occidentalis associated mesonivirus 1]QNM37795.1 putative replicase [Frankliniella occidentalis associated mesonivirus 1]
MLNLHRKVRHFVKTTLPHYNFILTADNVDLNGILDLEEYVSRSAELTDEIINKALAPFYYAFYTIYQHLGCYWLSNAIYPKGYKGDLLEYLNGLQHPLPQHHYQPDYAAFCEELGLPSYLGFTPVQNLYNFWADKDILEKNTPTDINLHIRPITYPHNYVDYKDVREGTSEQVIYLKGNYKNLSDIIDVVRKLQNKGNQVWTYVEQHPTLTQFRHYNQTLILNLWVNDLYQANLNISHFDYGLRASNSCNTEVPLIGNVNTIQLRKCNDPICRQIPETIKTIVDYGCVPDLVDSLEPDSINLRRVNPLVEFDERVAEVGITTDQHYHYPVRKDSPVFVDKNLIDYFNEQGLNLKVPPQHPEESDHADQTYHSDYRYRPSTKLGVVEDIQLFNLNYSGAISPVSLLMAHDYTLQTLEDEVLPSDGEPNYPNKVTETTVKNKHKSAGTPYNHWGDSEFFRKLFGEHRDAINHHDRHSIKLALTTIIKKDAISTKNRDRTILAISSLKTELGRRLFRRTLNKIKVRAVSHKGPILIGFTKFRLGFHDIYAKLTDGFEGEAVKLGGCDYPKWDRKVSSLLVWVCTILFYELNDPYLLYNLDENDQNDLFHEYVSECVQTLNDYCVFENLLLIKPGGITSGNSRTADGNSGIHMLFDAHATFSELMRSTPDNFQLHREVRDFVTRVSFSYPAQYLQEQPIHNTPGVASYIKTNIIRNTVLSDDGLSLFDSRLINYARYFGHSGLVSTYVIEPEKYSINNPEDGAEEFLSQHTFTYCDHKFPLPVFARIYSALILSNNKRVNDPSINYARLIALYTELFPYNYVSGYPKEKKFLQALYDYICTLRQHVTYGQLREYGIDLGGDEQAIIQSKELNNIVRSLYGFDLAEESKQLKSLAEVSTFYSCIVCESKTQFICTICNLGFCNNLNDSHLRHHIEDCKHNSYVGIYCKTCRKSDLTQLYFTRIGTMYLYYCSDHRVGTTQQIYDSGIHLHANINQVSVLTQNARDYLKNYITSLMLSQYTECIRNGMLLLNLGLHRPYYHLILLLMKIENDNAKDYNKDIPFEEHSIIQDGSTYTYKVKISLNYKYNKHNTYVGSSGDFSQKLLIDVSYEPNSITSGYYFWKFTTNSPIVKIIETQRDRLEAILANTRIFLGQTAKNYLTSPKAERITYLPIDYELPETTTQVLNSVRKHMFTFVQGPPGTGKTFAAAHLIKHLVKHKQRVLVLGPSHKSVDVSANAYHKLSSQPAVRVFCPSHDQQCYTDPAIPQVKVSMTDKLVFSTIQSYQVCKGTYDFVIIDEFSQIGDGYLIQMMQELKGQPKLIFFGDPYQLGTVDDYRLTLPLLFSNTVCFHTENAKGEQAANMIMFTKQYRSHPDIVKLVSDYSYDGKLVPMVPAHDRATFENYLHSPIHIIPVKAGPETKIKHPHNVAEGEFINNYFTHQYNNFLTYAIICAYNTQTQYIKTNVVLPRAVHVGTLDSFQGDEADIVFVLLTRGNQFTLNHNRLNVAISRARCTLYVTRPEDRAPYPSFFYEPQYVFESKPETEAIHQHVCTSCKTVYQHLHYFRFRQHRQYPKQCPNPICPEYYGKGSQEQRNNPTGSAIIEAIVNLRNMTTHAPQAANEISPYYSDYIFFDTEFVNLHEVEQDARKVAVCLAYSARYSDRHHLNLCGAPELPTDKGIQIITLPDRKHFINLKPRRLDEDMIKIRDELYRKATKNYKNQKTIVQMAALVRQAAAYTTSKPIIVTYGGMNDWPFLQQVNLNKAQAVCHKCYAPATYYGNTQYHCSVHAALNASHMEKFVNLIYLNITTTGNDTTNYVRVNGITYDQYDPPTKGKSLSAVHSHYCQDVHGDAHIDPGVDTKMTQCIFDKLWNKIYQKDKTTYRPRNYDQDLASLKRIVLEEWYSNNKDLKVCELGGGNKPSPVAIHNIDYPHDMNNHECALTTELYIDSIYYRSTAPTKESFIYYDANPAHYEKSPNGYVYTASKYSIYHQKEFRVFTGSNAFYRHLPVCTNEQVDIQTKLPHLDLQCANVCNGTTLCSAHVSHLDYLTKVNQLLEYGIQFIHYLPNTMPESVQLPYPVDFDPLQMRIPNYEDRKPTGYLMQQQKVIQILNALSGLLLSQNLETNASYLLFGAAGYRTTPMLDYLESKYPGRFDYIDPNLSPDTPRHHNITIKEYKPAKKAQLVIADVYSNQDWFSELKEWTENYLSNGGHLVFKITCSFKQFKQLDELAAHFSIVDIIKLKIKHVSSELWVVLGDYYAEEKIKKVNLQNLAYGLWYNMQNDKLIYTYETDQTRFKFVSNHPSSSFTVR